MDNEKNFEQIQKMFSKEALIEHVGSIDRLQRSTVILLEVCKSQEICIRALMRVCDVDKATIVAAIEAIKKEDEIKFMDENNR